MLFLRGGGGAPTGEEQPDHTQFLLFNIGDCRAAVQYQDGEVEQLTVDHTTQNAEEKKRLDACPGMHYDRHGRVLGRLEPTRTIGDADVKGDVGAGGVLSDPSIRHVSVRTSGYPGPTQFTTTVIVLASDGIYTFAKNDQVQHAARCSPSRPYCASARPAFDSLQLLTKFLRTLQVMGIVRQAEAEGQASQAAQRLVKEVVEHHESDDDITCIVLFLSSAGAGAGAVVQKSVFRR